MKYLVSILVGLLCTPLLGGCQEDRQERPQCPDCTALEAPSCHGMVCNLETEECEPAPLADGTPCSSPESCSIGDECVAGECTPGRQVECDTAPQCRIATCDPASDRCETESAADGTSCSTLCAPDAECVSGECAGEEPDCSWLGDECSLGLCHPQTGDCSLRPREAGTECSTVEPGCSVAACDGLGTCIVEPLDDGTTCDDGNSCTSEDQCSAGRCAGVEGTSCESGDGCCPAGCEEDDDCCEASGPIEDPSSWSLEYDAVLSETEGVVLLTPALNWRLGQVWLERDITRPFVARFRYRAAASEGAADGLVFMFYKSRDYEPGRGGSLGFHEGGRCEIGEGDSGYGVEVDNWNNRCDRSTNHFGIVYGSIGNHLFAVDDERTFDGEWHDMIVTVGEDFIQVVVDDTSIGRWEGEIDRTHGGLGFSAATGGASDEYQISDVTISCL